MAMAAPVMAMGMAIAMAGTAMATANGHGDIIGSSISCLNSASDVLCFTFRQHFPQLSTLIVTEEQFENYQKKLPKNINIEVKAKPENISF